MYLRHSHEKERKTLSLWNLHISVEKLRIDKKEDKQDNHDQSYDMSHCDKCYEENTMDLSDKEKEIERCVSH